MVSSPTPSLDYSSLDEPLVSVITPTYNRPEYLQEAIASALAQTYRNLEIIVSDNGSPVNPQELIESFDDGRIRFFRHEKNLGMIANTLYAFQQARGKYVACLLDDDLWEPDFLAKLVPPLEAHPDLTLSFCDHSVIDATGKLDDDATEQCSQQYGRAHLAEGIHQPFYRLALVDAAVPTATSAVMRRDWVDWSQIPPQIGGTWDSYLRYLYCREGRGAYYIPERLTRYRAHDQTDTMQNGRRSVQGKIGKAQAEIFCYQQFLQDDRLQDLHPFFQAKLAHWMTTLGIGLMRDQKLPDARQWIWRSLTQRFSPRAIAALCVSFAPGVIACRF